jgi:hypothetical protein
MTCVALFILASAALLPLVGAQGGPDCGDAESCRVRALDAKSRGAYESFHDFAWRAVQTGRPNDPDLMYLLARAQALSGRRRDALIMLRRLAEAGAVNDAATDEDFRRVRELPEWGGVLALANRPAAVAPPVAAPTAPPPVAAPTSPPPVAAPPSPARASAEPPRPPVSPEPVRALRVDPAIVDEAARFSTGAFVPAGLAYDGVSRRFVFGDRAGRRLFVVGEGSDRSIDLVRADSAGFEDVTAMAIDRRRGHLWVASTDAGGASAALHHLQLISGRVLSRIPAPGADGPIRLGDLDVAGDGSVFVIDVAAPRILVLRPGATALEPLMTLTMPDPVSLASADGRFAYLAHRDGIARVDLQARRAAPLNPGKGIALAGFEHLRWHRDGLVGVQVQPDASRGLVRLRLSADGRTVTEATLIEPPSASDGIAFPTIMGDDLYYLVARRSDGGDSASGVMSVLVRRVRLR